MIQGFGWESVNGVTFGAEGRRGIAIESPNLSNLPFMVSNSFTYLGRGAYTADVPPNYAERLNRTWAVVGTGGMATAFVALG